MSLTSTQIDTLIDANCGTNSTSYPAAQKTIDKNLALDKLLSIIIPASGKNQFDDSGHTADPIVTTNLVSGQRDYHYTIDQQGNVILDIYRVMVADEDGIFYDLNYVDQQSKGGAMGMVDGQNDTGSPSEYDKTGNGIFLDPIPDYSYSYGVKMFINRESTYFVVGDTTKKSGIAGIYHEYLALRPSYQYCYRKKLEQAKPLQVEMLIMEKEIKEYYKRQKNRDVSVSLTPPLSQDHI